MHDQIVNGVKKSRKVKMSSYDESVIPVLKNKRFRSVSYSRTESQNQSPQKSVKETLPNANLERLKETLMLNHEALKADSSFRAGSDIYKQTTANVIDIAYLPMYKSILEAEDLQLDPLKDLKYLDE